MASMSKHLSHSTWAPKLLSMKHALQLSSCMHNSIADMDLPPDAEPGELVCSKVSCQRAKLKPSSCILIHVHGAS